jgi:hypothetical protein
MSRPDRHPPRGDLRRAQLADPPLAEHAYRLREQPAQLLRRLWLAVVLSEIDVDKLGERRCLGEPLFPAELLEGSLERLRRRLLGGEAAALHALGAAATDPVPVCPPPPNPALPGERKDLSLLRHLVTSGCRGGRHGVATRARRSCPNGWQPPRGASRTRRT